MPELTDRAAKQQVEAWMSAHRPGVQGEKDGMAGIPKSDSSEITPYERQLIESFEREIQTVKQSFTNRESYLYSKFYVIKGKMLTQKKEYDRLRTIVGDRDPEVYVPPYILLVISLISLITLSILNIYAVIPVFQERYFIDTYFLSVLFDNDVVPILFGTAITICNLGIGYYAGRLIRQHQKKVPLTRYISTMLLFFLLALIMIIGFSGFDAKSNLIVTINIIVLLLVAISSFLAYDSEPTYPKFKRKYERYLGKLAAIASKRLGNLEIHQRIQDICVEGAQEIDQQYRRSIQKVRPEDGISIITENILPEFKTVVLKLINEEDISKYMHT